MCTFAAEYKQQLHMNKSHSFLVLLCLLTLSLSASADNYTTFLTADRGFTEVTTTTGFTDNANDYYILTSAENTGLIVGVGRYEAKPDWASEESKALRYKSAATDPALDLTNFFTIEKNVQYIGLRNVVFNTDLFQTHDNAGFMYVNTYTDPNLDEWSYLTPTYQNGYWLFESGKYPISSGNWACGFLGPWNNRVEDGQPMALNRRNTEGDEAGHYRLFRITKANLNKLLSNASWDERAPNASDGNPVDATQFITNPSFETGDETGWTLIGKDPNGNDEFKVREYGMTNKDGAYLMNAFQWWASSLGVTQTADVPSGVYTLSGVVATWEGRTVTFTGNDATVTANGQGDGTGIPVSVNLTIGMDSKLTISAGSTGQWWVEGHEGETQTFFKLDNVRLTCKGVFLNGFAKPLPNDDATLLTANQWYYYEVSYGSDFRLIGNLTDMIYSTDGDKLLANITTAEATREMTINKGRIYFKTTRSDATLKVMPKREIVESNSFSVVALNVDGLPNKILTYKLNEDGPGEEGTKKISQYLASKNYDFIGCSEDFNYNGTLMGQLNSNYSCGTIRNTLSVGGVLNGGFPIDTDGLNLIWKNSTCSASNESWTRWESTVATDGNQYVRKGYRHYDMTIGGQTFDVFILHMDAGDTNATDSRHSQWRQLAAAINNADATRPKLIIGDTNSRWTREDITANFMNLLNANLTASDVWVEFYRNGIYPTTDMADLTDKSDLTNYSNYEIVDKIIYINPKAANTLQLVPQSFRIEQDYIYDNIDHDGNTKPLGDHNPVVVEFKYIKSGDVLPLTIELANSATDNEKKIADASGSTADVTLTGRTLYKDDSWNTICLPFDLTLDGSPLAGATAKTLTAATMTGTHVDLTFGDDVTELVAGTPYIIKWADGEDIYEPVFTGATLTAPTPQTIHYDGNRIQFIGYYDALDITAADEDIFYLTADNELQSTAIDRTLKACRAYFRFTPDEGVPVKALTFSHNIGDVLVGLTETKDDEQIGNVVTYNLAGQRVMGPQRLAQGDASHLKKGIYIRAGKKIVIR